MNKLLQSLLRRHRPDVSALSAHLDGRLDAPEAQALNAHIAACDACRLEMDGLRSVRASLRAMPQVEHPRSFRLRIADVERVPLPASASPGGRAMRLMPVLSGVAAIVFVIAVGADLESGGTFASSKSGDTANVMSAPRQEIAAARMAESTASAAQDFGAAAGGLADGTFTAAQPPAADGSFTTEGTPGKEAAGNDTVASPVGSSASAPEINVPGATGAVPGDTKGTIASPTPELLAASSRPTSSDGVDGLRIVEVIAGVVALAAAVAAVGWRMRSRGEQA